MGGCIEKESVWVWCWIVVLCVWTGCAGSGGEAPGGGSIAGSGGEAPGGGSIAGSGGEAPGGGSIAGSGGEAPGADCSQTRCEGELVEYMPVEGQVQCDEAAGPPAVSLYCDGRDNDCDGRTDEGCAGGSCPCPGNVPGECVALPTGDSQCRIACVNCASCLDCQRDNEGANCQAACAGCPVFFADGGPEGCLARGGVCGGVYAASEASDFYCRPRCPPAGCAPGLACREARVFSYAPPGNPAQAVVVGCTPLCAPVDDETQISVLVPAGQVRDMSEGGAVEPRIGEPFVPVWPFGMCPMPAASPR